MNPYLPKSIELGPKAISRLLDRIPDDRYDERLEPDRFTIREVLAHLADWEPILRARIERLRSAPGSTIEMFNEEQMAIDHGYAQQDVAQNLALWTAERAKTAVLIRSLNAESLAIEGKHPLSGSMSVADVANMMVGHDLYHVEQLTEYLA